MKKYIQFVNIIIFPVKTSTPRERYSVTQKHYHRLDDTGHGGSVPHLLDPLLGAVVDDCFRVERLGDRGSGHVQHDPDQSLNLLQSCHLRLHKPGSKHISC